MKATTEICTNCQYPNDLHHMGEYHSSEWCFSCNYWWGRVQEKDQLLVVNNRIYQDNKAQPKGTPYLGFGGRTFRYRRLGESAWHESNNMGGGGEIPEMWREQLPDNAEFENVKVVTYPEGSLYEAAFDIT